MSLPTLWFFKWREGAALYFSLNCKSKPPKRSTKQRTSTSSMKVLVGTGTAGYCRTKNKNYCTRKCRTCQWQNHLGTLWLTAGTMVGSQTDFIFFCSHWVLAHKGFGLVVNGSVEEGVLRWMTYNCWLGMLQLLYIAKGGREPPSGQKAMCWWDWFSVLPIRFFFF